ncbi:MAG: hypothetical protein SXV54_10635 [Chloroflexota bacterium]|nr:hypothetical protein [Chloroflexota bacterium]
MTPDLIAWLSAPDDVHERRSRITDYLANEGYELPPPPPDAGYDEAGTTHRVRGQEMTVAYSVENETDHIILGRIEHGDEWAIELLKRIPPILRTGHVVRETFDKVIYQSRRTYRHPDGWWCPLRAVVKMGPHSQWYVDTFYPWYPKR